MRYLAAVAHICGWSHLLDIRDSQHAQTALHVAVVADRPCVVRLLVVAGASPDVLSRLGQTPMMLACAQRRAHCIGPLTQSVDGSERDRLTQYCTDVGLMATTHLPPPPPAPPPSHLPDINTLDFSGRLLTAVDASV